jgi:uncharacterized protein
MRLFFITDIHGSELCFRKFLNAAKAYEADVLLLGGDICSKRIAPVFSRGQHYVAEVSGERIVARSEVELKALLQRARDAAMYPYVCTDDEWLDITSDPQRQSDLFVSLSVESVARWVEIAEKRLGGTRVRCFIGAGNDDPVEIDEILRGSTYVEDPDWRVVQLNGFSLVTVCDSNPTPWHSPREISEEQYALKLSALAEMVEDHSRSIFNLHVPPRDSTLDLAPEIDHEFRVQYAGAEPRMISVGSTAVREAIERFEPLLGLHGHVHESKGVVRIGRTLCLNPGSSYGDGILQGALINLGGPKGVRSYQFTVG